MKVWRVVLFCAGTGDEYSGRFAAPNLDDAVEQARAAAVEHDQGTDTDEWELKAGYAYEGDIG